MHRPTVARAGRRPLRTAPERRSGHHRGVHHYSIATVAAQSDDFRRVLWTGTHSQLVIMTIPVDGAIGEEVHEDIDQILSFVAGTGEARVGGETRAVEPGDLVVVPAGTRHDFVNTGPTPLVLYTVYGPPDHADGAVHHTKRDADAAEESGADEPPS
jgi:mannose-6-phosphate isomerase-like protein (cupin superfamily)